MPKPFCESSKISVTCDAEESHTPVRGNGGRCDDRGAAGAARLRGLLRQIRFCPRPRDELGHSEFIGPGGFCVGRHRGVFCLSGEEGSGLKRRGSRAGGGGGINQRALSNDKYVRLLV